MPDYQRVDDGNPDGALLGGASTDLVAFHGATPIARATIATMTASATASAATHYINLILSALVAKGLISFS